jgi:hypothetical protein
MKELCSLLFTFKIFAFRYTYVSACDMYCVYAKSLCSQNTLVLAHSLMSHRDVTLPSDDVIVVGM